MAEEADVDLVEVAPNARPPVCRLMDYGKFRYQEQKKAQEQKAKQKVTLRYRGREMAHQEFGTDLLNKVKEDLADIAQVESFPKLEGRQMIMVLAPKKKK